MCVLSKFIGWIADPQGDGVRRWDSQKVRFITSAWDLHFPCKSSWKTSSPLLPHEDIERLHSWTFKFSPEIEPTGVLIWKISAHHWWTTQIVGFLSKHPRLEIPTAIPGWPSWRVFPATGNWASVEDAVDGTSGWQGNIFKLVDHSTLFQATPNYNTTGLLQKTQEVPSFQEGRFHYEGNCYTQWSQLLTLTSWSPRKHQFPP